MVAASPALATFITAVVSFLLVATVLTILVTITIKVENREIKEKPDVSWYKRFKIRNALYIMKQINKT